MTTNEMASLYAAQRAMMYMDSQRVEMGKVKVVVNRYQKDSRACKASNFNEAFGDRGIPDDSCGQRRGSEVADGRQADSEQYAIGKSLATMADKLVEKREKNQEGKARVAACYHRFFVDCQAFL